jgi:type IV pilus assembly protein PilA
LSVKRNIRRGLIGLFLAFLAVVAVALALPKVNRQLMLGREQCVIREIGTLNQAEMAYHARLGRYAQSIVELGPPAKEHKCGCIFSIVRTPGGYSLRVVPEAYLDTGSRTFYSDQSMVIHQNHSAEPATAASPELR